MSSGRLKYSSGLDITCGKYEKEWNSLSSFVGLRVVKVVALWKQYSTLKRELAKQYLQDLKGYMDGKDEFIKTIEKKALEWQVMTQTHQNLLAEAYAAFNVRDIDAVFAVMHPDVEWANGMEGGYVHGHNAVRDYWTRQWNLIDPHVKPIGFQLSETGRTVVDVHQVVRDLEGNLIVDQMVQHIYTIQDNLIRRMDIQESST